MSNTIEVRIEIIATLDADQPYGDDDEPSMGVSVDVRAQESTPSNVATVMALLAVREAEVVLREEVGKVAGAFEGEGEGEE
jgi:hypothetical protein